MSTTITGLPCWPQVAIGKAKKFQNEAPAVSTYSVEADWTETEFKAWRIAVGAVDEQLAKMISEQHSPDGAAVIRVQRTMLKDPLLESKIYSNIFDKHQNVQLAVKNAVDDVQNMFEDMHNDYLLERGADLRDICNRLIGILRGVQPSDTVPSEVPVVVVARNLTPTQVAAMDPEMVLGFATDHGSCTSHTAIIAQGLGIPSVMGCVNLYDKVQDGDLLVIDGQQGTVVVNPNNEELEGYRTKQKNLSAANKELSALQLHAVKTKDGRSIHLGVNVSSRADLDRLTSLQPGSVGLLRSELLFTSHTTAPDEEEQFHLYRKAAQAMGGRPVTIRTWDVGGDKKLPWLDQHGVENPFLGHRGIRLSLQHHGLFRTQLRAILRASNFGQVRLLFPMISTLEETSQLPDPAERV